MRILRPAGHRGSGRAVGELTAEQTGGTAEAQAHTEAVQTAQTAALKKHSRMDLDAELDELLGGL